MTITDHERELVSLGVVDDDTETDTEPTRVWGDPDGGPAKPQLERHVRIDIDCTVSRVPASGVHNP